MRKPGFGIVSLVLVLLALFGSAVKFLAPLLPRDVPNRMAQENADFLRQATFERVNWLPFSQDAFGEARRTDKPVLMLIGTPWSQTGRFADRNVFTDSEVQTYLSRHFVCVRIDGVDDPSWMASYLPITRYSLPFFPAFQVWILDPTGKMYDYVSPFSSELFNSQTFLDQLIRSRDRLTAIRGNDPSVNPPGLSQLQDIERLQAGPSSSVWPDFGAFIAAVRKEVDPVNGGFVLSNYQVQAPLAADALLRLGELDLLNQAFMPMLRSPMVDWLDGGFFRVSAKRDWTQVQFDKIAVQNAQIMMTCLRLYDNTDDELLNRLAMSTFDALVKEFSPSGYVAPCVTGDDGFLSRSRRSSFSVRVLRDFRSFDLLTSEEINFLRNDMGLRVETNPQMVIRFQNLEIPKQQHEMVRTILEKLADYRREVRRRPSGGAYLDVNGNVCAKLLAAGRYWGDESRLSKATSLYDKLADFRDADDVRHSLFPSRNIMPFLGDYLAFADASLNDYLATGRVDSLNSGLKVLLRARDRFSTETPGIWAIRPVALSSENPADANVPEIGDGERESTAAQAIRLLNDYGRLLCTGSATAESQLATGLTQEAVNMVNRYAEVAAPLGIPASGYIVSALDVMHDIHAFAVGPDAQKIADRLSRLAPGRLVAAAYGPVRPDLQRRTPGIYVVEATQVKGPVSVEEAEALLIKPDQLGRTVEN